MDSETVILNRRESIVELVINRPERRNALDWQTLVLLHARLTEVASDPTVKVIVLTGQGDRAFSSGVDLAGMGEGSDQRLLHESRAQVATLIQAMWNAPQPILAKVRGFALAGGFGLAMAADVVIASESAIFGTPEAQVGLWPFQITVPLLRFAPPRFINEQQFGTPRECYRGGYLLALPCREHSKTRIEIPVPEAKPSCPIDRAVKIAAGGDSKEFEILSPRQFFIHLIGVSQVAHLSPNSPRLCIRVTSKYQNRSAHRLDEPSKKPKKRGLTRPIRALDEDYL